MLQTDKDYKIISTLDEELGMRELRAKVNGKAGIKAEYAPNRFSIHRELCYHAKSVEVVRKYLDSGVLSEYVFEYFEKGDRCWAGEDYRRYHVLVACVMTLGCTLPERMREKMDKMQNPAYIKVVKEKQSGWALKPLANIQLKKALAEYEDGKPYDFGNTTMLEASMTRMFPGKATTKEIGHRKLIEITQKNGKVIPQIVGPPADDEIGLKHLYPNHVCATCGASEKKDGGELLACGRCQDRKYCSKECQKRHWKMHKIICMRPADQMAKFMQSIEPIGFGGGEDLKDMMGDSKVAFMS